MTGQLRLLAALAALSVSGCGLTTRDADPQRAVEPDGGGGEGGSAGTAGSAGAAPGGGFAGQAGGAGEPALTEPELEWAVDVGSSGADRDGLSGFFNDGFDLDVAATDDGGFVLAGGCEGPTRFALKTEMVSHYCRLGKSSFIASFDAGGQAEWVRFIEGSNAARAVAVADDGAIWVGVGVRYDGTQVTLAEGAIDAQVLTLPARGFVLGKFDRAGALLATLSNGPSRWTLVDLTTLSNGRVAVAMTGFHDGAVDSDDDLLSEASDSGPALAIFDSQGRVRSAAHIGTDTASLHPVEISAFADDSLLWAGRVGGQVAQLAPGVSIQSEFSYDLYASSTSASGAFAAVAHAPGSGNEAAYAGATLADGGFYLTGSMAGRVRFGPDAVLNTGEWLRFFLARYRADGTALWATAGEAQDPQRSNAYDVAVSGGNAVIAGVFVHQLAMGEGARSITLQAHGDERDEDAFVASYDDAGRLRWALRAGGSSNDSAARVVETADGALLVVGTYGSQALFGEGQAGQSRLVADPDGLLERRIFAAKYRP